MMEIGMDEGDFENKFLADRLLETSSQVQMGNPTMRSPGGRRFIGAKGIGKLALLSCSTVRQYHIKDRRNSSDGHIGGVINNDDLNDAIKADRSSEEYNLGDS